LIQLRNEAEGGFNAYGNAAQRDCVTERRAGVQKRQQRKRAKERSLESPQQRRRTSSRPLSPVGWQRASEKNGRSDQTLARLQ
jgi:hypothetical protein